MTQWSTVIHEISKQTVQRPRLGKIFSRWHLVMAITSLVDASPRNNIFKQKQSWCHAACGPCRPIAHEKDDL